MLAALHPPLEQALDLGAAERAGRLASLHDEQPELARELETLLAVEQTLDTRGFLAGMRSAA